MLNFFRAKTDSISVHDVKDNNNTSLSLLLSNMNDNKQNVTKLHQLENSEYMSYSNGVATISNLLPGVCVYDFGSNVVTSLVITQSTQASELDIAQIVFVAGDSMSYNIPSTLSWYDKICARTSARVELTIQKNSIR